MEELDALLHDLQQTNQKLLTQKPADPVPKPASDVPPYRNGSNNVTSAGQVGPSRGSWSTVPTAQASVSMGQPPYQQTGAGTGSGRGIVGDGVGDRSSGIGGRGGLQANMMELNQMLAGLDQPDPPAVRVDMRRPSGDSSCGYPGSTISYMSSDYANESPQPGRHQLLSDRVGGPTPFSVRPPVSRNGGAGTPPIGPPISSPATTDIAAQHAARELDDLMSSLNKFKLQHQADIQVTPAASDDQHLDRTLGKLTRDLARQGVTTAAKGNCLACNKPILGKVITALGANWHWEHFVCANCMENLSTQNYFERNSKPYCEPCYQALFSPKCAYCKEPILDKCLTAMDQTWHPEHFFCNNCQRSFDESAGFHERDHCPYCPECFFDLFGAKCGGCGRPITDTYVSALDAQWHNQCFVCQECGIGFGGGSFFESDGLPYCETHYHLRRGSLCCACTRPVTGRCINALGKRYHPEHFVCSFCLRQLNKGTFKEQAEKPYCHECFIKLFG